MRYILSLISLVLIGVLAFQLATVSAVSVVGTISGEKRVVTVSPKVQLLKFKRSLAVVKAKIALLKVKIANLQKVIDIRTKRKLPVATQNFQMQSLMDQYNQAEQTASEIQKKIDATASGVINKI